MSSHRHIGRCAATSELPGHQPKSNPPFLLSRTVNYRSIWLPLLRIVGLLRRQNIDLCLPDRRNRFLGAKKTDSYACHRHRTKLLISQHPTGVRVKTFRIVNFRNWFFQIMIIIIISTNFQPKQLNPSALYHEVCTQQTKDQTPSNSNILSQSRLVSIIIVAIVKLRTSKLQFGSKFLLVVRKSEIHKEHAYAPKWTNQRVPHNNVHSSLKYYDACYFFEGSPFCTATRDHHWMMRLTRLDFERFSFFHDQLSIWTITITFLHADNPLALYHELSNNTNISILLSSQLVSSSSSAELLKKSEFKKKNKLLVRHQNVQSIRESLIITYTFPFYFDDIFFLMVCTNPDDTFDYPDLI